MAVVAFAPVAPDAPRPTPESLVPPIAASLLPAKYNRPATSGLTVDVKPVGANRIDLELP